MLSGEAATHSYDETLRSAQGDTTDSFKMISSRFPGARVKRSTSPHAHDATMLTDEDWQLIAPWLSATNISGRDLTSGDRYSPSCSILQRKSAQAAILR
jgi:hypothetical protein